MQPTQDPEELRQWIGRTETQIDTLHTKPANLMEMTFDSAPTLKKGDPLPTVAYRVECGRFGFGKGLRLVL